MLLPRLRIQYLGQEAVFAIYVVVHEIGGWEPKVILTSSKLVVPVAAPCHSKWIVAHGIAGGALDLLTHPEAFAVGVQEDFWGGLGRCRTVELHQLGVYPGGSDFRGVGDGDGFHGVRALATSRATRKP